MERKNYKKKTQSKLDSLSSSKNSSENYDKSQIDPLLFCSPLHTFFSLRSVSAFLTIFINQSPQSLAQTEICLNIENATCFPFKVKDKSLAFLSPEPLTMVTSSNVMAEIMFTVYAVLCFFHAFLFFLCLPASFSQRNVRAKAKKSFAPLFFHR